jgi:hypothetical protein
VTGDCARAASNVSLMFPLPRFLENSRDERGDWIVFGASNLELRG